MRRRAIRDVGNRQGYVVGRDVRAIDRRRQDATDDAFGALHIGSVAGDDETVAVGVQRYFERGFDGGEVTVVLSEQANAIR
jgi:hypothetical protein